MGCCSSSTLTLLLPILTSRALTCAAALGILRHRRVLSPRPIPPTQRGTTTPWSTVLWGLDNLIFHLKFQTCWFGLFGSGHVPICYHRPVQTFPFPFACSINAWTGAKWSEAQQQFLPHPPQPLTLIGCILASKLRTGKHWHLDLMQTLTQEFILLLGPHHYTFTGNQGVNSGAHETLAWAENRCQVQPFPNQVTWRHKLSRGPFLKCPSDLTACPNSLNAFLIVSELQCTFITLAREFSSGPLPGPKLPNLHVWQ